MLVVVAGPSSEAQSHFTDVSIQVGLVQEAKHSWGNPVWGDINNDGYLDLIVPCHGLSSSHGPFVYLNNAGLSFTDIRTTCGIGPGPELDSRDWHGFSFVSTITIEISTYILPRAQRVTRAAPSNVTFSFRAMVMARLPT